ncbi:MAG: ABC transporter substrate-binding protein [Acidimicrobiia bacterium]|nr:ABC transporter substrate-binding protein [Acidimicrobiia bacterium]
MIALLRRAAFLVVLVLVAAACGDDAPGPDASASDSDSTASATGDPSQEASYPVVIEHAMGSTTVEERPERIVSLNVQWTDAVLVMGMQPVAYVLDQASLETEPYPWHVDKVAGSQRIDTTGTIPFEQIAALQPDLILLTYLPEERQTFDTLDEIAPTIGLLGELQVDPWQDQVEVMGRVLGEPERAEQVIGDVEGQVEALARDLPGLGGKTYVAANYVPGDGIHVVADPDDGSSRLFYELGMEIAPDIVALDQQAVGRVEISMEQVGLLDADFVGILAHDADPSELPGWDQLTAVQTGAVIDFEFADVVGINTPTPLSLPYVIDLIRPALEAVASAG